ncbi:uncharacterized protein TNCV_2560461 [Trichonephila clavipes]|uniref:Mutator-like transposase domain-containing protein n=1 Tax=Trichonephila clavipes TaxID=2585209 RepID=A0A8X6R4Y6_TRICX|nr:uncharacterized protein TNCV_2560461 [Trichonephila clavipes]
MRCQTLEDSCLNDLNCCENSEAPHYVIMDVQFLKGLLKNLLCDVCKSYSLKFDIGGKLGDFPEKISVFCTSCDIIKSSNFTSRRISDSEVKSLNDVRSQVKRAYQSNSAITDIDVTFDGTWLTRGHSSQIGVGCVIDLLTGFVMDFEIMSKRCIECEHAKSGSSCAMEQEAALKLWQRSGDSGFRYTTLLSDGDAKTYQYLNTKKVYGPEIKIKKEECINHVSKRLGYRVPLTSHCWATRGLLVTDHVILNHGQVTWTTPELASPLLSTTPHQREDVSALDRFNVHRCPTLRVFSGTGLELVTRRATIRYLYHSATVACIRLTKLTDYQQDKGFCGKQPVVSLSAHFFLTSTRVYL